MHIINKLNMGLKQEWDSGLHYGRGSGQGWGQGQARDWALGLGIELGVRGQVLNHDQNRDRFWGWSHVCGWLSRSRLDLGVGPGFKVGFQAYD